MHTGFEGIQRALPASQAIQLSGLGIWNWNPNEVLAALDVFKGDKNRTYRVHEIQWDLIVKSLRDIGVEKTIRQLQYLYQNLREDPAHEPWIRCLFIRTFSAI